MDKRIRELYNESILSEALARYGIAKDDVQLLDGFESFMYDYHKGALPRSDDLMDRSIIVPVPSLMSKQDTQDVIDGIREVAAALL